MFLAPVERKLRALLKNTAKPSLTYKLLFGLAAVVILAAAFFFIKATRATPSTTVISTTKPAAHTTANLPAAAAPAPSVTSPSGSAVHSDNTSNSGVSKPAKAATAPISSPTPIDPGKLVLSTNRITVGPDLPGSVTITPSAGSMFYTISVQSVLNISCDVSVIQDVTTPFTVHFSYPNDPISDPIPGIYNLTILAQDKTKAIQYYHLQLTALPPTSNQNF
jgi:hypothetical protein